MTNEELAQLIKNGEERELELWEQVKRYALKTAYKWVKAFKTRSDVDVDDLVIESYIAMCEALKTYERDGGSFNTWYGYHLKNRYCAAYGLRTKRTAKDPLNDAISIHTPVEGAEDITIEDTIEDPRSAESFERVERELYNQQLHAVLCVALTAIPAQCREVIDRRYFGGHTIKDIAADLGTQASVISSRERQGLHALRRLRSVAELRGFSSFNYYTGTGLCAFKASGASIQEHYLFTSNRYK